MADEKKDRTYGGRLTSKWLDNPHGDRSRRSRKQEDRIAKQMGGRRLPRSGGKHWSKYDGVFTGDTDGGDVATPHLHIEHKRTDNKSISIKREWLDKVKEGARKFGKTPALAITFEDPAKPKSPPEDWILLPLETVKKMLGIKGEGE